MIVSANEPLPGKTTRRPHLSRLHLSRPHRSQPHLSQPRLSRPHLSRLLLGWLLLGWLPLALLPACSKDDGPSPPPAAGTGACCTEGDCRILSSVECFDIGVYLGDGSTCAPPACSPLGACCDSRVCTLALEVDCGPFAVYLGDDTVCVPNPCSPTGACCVAGDCRILSETDCDQSSGDYWGDDSPCEALPDSSGGPNRSGVLLLHYAEGVTQTEAGRNCRIGIESCDEVVTRAPADGVVLATVLAAFPPSASPNVESVLFGIQHFVEIPDWIACGPTVEVTTNWPEPFSGIRVRWSSPVSERLFPVCWFVAYASEGSLELVDHPVLGIAGFGDGSVPDVRDPARVLGTLGFGTDPGRRRCPCP